VNDPLLFVSGEYPPDIGGVGDYTVHLREALDALGRPADVLSRTQVRRWDARSLVRLLRSAPKSGVVHIQFQAGAYELLGDVCLMPLLLRRTRPRIRVATTFHDTRVPYLFPRAGSLRQAAVRLLARTSDAVIAADERDLIALGGPSPRRHQIPIGSNVQCAPGAEYDRAAFRARLGLAPHTLTVAYFGLLNASKGLDLLLDAFDLVAGSRPDAKLLLLGGEVGASDPTDRLTAARLEARLARLGERVVRSGWLGPSALSAHLVAADVAVLPFVDGASPRRGSLLACAEHGLPIVSTEPASGAVASAVHSVPPNAPALANAVLEIADDPALSARLRAQSRTLAEQSSWSRIATAHIALYERLSADT
jgi:glycosyltransferase involved in cell wall biosynthesis